MPDPTTIEQMAAAVGMSPTELQAAQAVEAPQPAPPAIWVLQQFEKYRAPHIADCREYDAEGAVIYPNGLCGYLSELECERHVAKLAPPPTDGIHVEASNFNNATVYLDFVQATCARLLPAPGAPEVLPEPAGLVPALVLLAVLARRR